MDPAAHPPAPTDGLPRAVVALLLAGALGYAWLVAANSVSCAGGSDSSGYFNSARLLGEGRAQAPARVPAGRDYAEFGFMAFQPLGFIMDEHQPRMSPTYPPGLPLHLLAASWVAGWGHAANLVNVFAALGCGGVLWALARHLGLTPAWAAVAVAWLWLCPLTLFSALLPMSDLLALGWSLTALYAALRSRGSPGWGMLAGATCAIAVLVRPSNALVVLPVAIALGLDLRAWTGLALGALPGAAFFICYNWRLYGTPLTTGYGDPATIFGRSFVLPNLTYFVRWIPGLLTPLVGLALAAPWLPSVRRRAMAVLALWVTLLIAFYAAYRHSSEAWWYLRFILPVFPVIILAALLVGQAAFTHPGTPRWVRSGLIVLLGLGACWQVRLNHRLEVLKVGAGEAHYVDAADWARDHLPPTAAIFCLQVSGAFYYYTPYLLVRWDQVERNQMTAIFAALAADHRPVFAALYAYETPEALTRMGASWRKLDTVGETTFWALEAAPRSP